ncbi:MAG TPA: YceI family protein [Terriglobales bacterium]|nr:YceI family protein [Terriglobales bacterium]
MTAVAMGTMNPRFLKLALVILTAVWAVVPPAFAQEATLHLDPEKTTLSFTLEATLHTVHGTFRLKNGAIKFNPATGAASGAVVIDATSGQTGNQRRDRNMHRDVLVSERYPEITFTPTRIIGNVQPQGESSVQVDGVLRLQGSDHPVTLPFKVQASESELRATTQFTVPYVAWGLKNPSTFFLHVADKVELSIAASGKLTIAAAGR